jgi:hypothetical protein
MALTSTLILEERRQRVSKDEAIARDRSSTMPASSFETHRFAMLLRMRL